jgi:DnaK suppressor protein
LTSNTALDPTLGHYRSRLLVRRSELLLQLADRPSELLHAGPLADDDQPATLHDQFVSLEMDRIINCELKLIDAALQRLDSGEYGDCEHCSDRISEKRLRAVPWARYCIQCEEEISTSLAAGTAARDDEGGAVA